MVFHSIPLKCVISDVHLWYKSCHTAWHAWHVRKMTDWDICIFVRYSVPICSVDWIIFCKSILLFYMHNLLFIIAIRYVLYNITGRSWFLPVGLHILHNYISFPRNPCNHACPPPLLPPLPLDEEGHLDLLWSQIWVGICLYPCLCLCNIS